MEIDVEQMAENLQAAGCGEEFIAEFRRVMAKGTAQEREQMLERQRRCILGELHDRQKKLECFDYLRHRLRQQEDEKNLDLK